MKYVVLALLLAIALPSAAGEIYKWVDQNGKVHYGDKAPDDNAAKSEVVDPKVNVVKVERSKAQVTKAPRRVDNRATQVPPKQTKPAKPSEPVSACEAQWRAFDESSACFNRCAVHLDGRRNTSRCNSCVDVRKPQCSR